MCMLLLAMPSALGLERHYVAKISLNSDKKTQTLEFTSSQYVLNAADTVGRTYGTFNIDGFDTLVWLADNFRTTITTIKFNSTWFRDARPKSMAGWFKGMTALKTVEGLDKCTEFTTDVTDMSSMFEGCTSIYDIDLGKIVTSKVENMSSMFKGSSVSIVEGLDNLDLTNVTDMHDMFRDCRALFNIPIGGTQLVLKTSKVADMSGMFCGCRTLPVINFKMSTPCLTNAKDMFSGCSALKKVAIEDFNTALVADMSRMFYNCTQLTDLDFTMFNTSSATDLSLMFYNCQSLTSADLSTIKLRSDAIADSMLYGCRKIRELKLDTFNYAQVLRKDSMLCGIGYANWPCHLTLAGGFDKSVLGEELHNDFFSYYKWLSGYFTFYTKLPAAILTTVADNNEDQRKTLTFTVADVSTPKGVNYSDGAYSIVPNYQGGRPSPDWWRCPHITKVVIDSTFASVRPRHTDFWFSNFQITSAYLEEIEGIWNLNTSEVTSMRSMYGGSDMLTSIDVSHFDTHNVTDMSGMFSGCRKLESIDLSHFDTSSLLTTQSMFANCERLSTLDLRSFRTDSLRNMAGMFGGCTRLKSVDLSTFNTRRVWNMRILFHGCQSLDSVDIRHFITDKVTDMQYMFFNCSSLKSIDVSNFNTSQVEDMEAMFSGCSGLTSLDLSTFNTSKVENMSSMFRNCSSLRYLDLSNFDTRRVIDMSYMFEGCTSLESVIGIITGSRRYKAAAQQGKGFDVSGFSTSKVGDMTRMFRNCSSLKELNLSNFTVKKTTSMNYMLYGCSGLDKLNLGSLDMANVTRKDSIFAHVGTAEAPCQLYVDGSFSTSVLGDKTGSGCYYWLGGYFAEPVVTAISTAEADSPLGPQPAYNLSGQRVGRSYKGIVIIGGKKALRR